MRSSVLTIYLVAVPASLTASCGSKSKVTKAPGGSGGPTSLSDLKLSQAMQLALPSNLQKAAGVKTGQANLALSTQKKSSEACEAVQLIDQELTNARSNGTFLCHLEVEKLELGKKYNVTWRNLPAGESNLDSQIWVDNTDPSDLKVYYCDNKKLAMKFSIVDYSGPGVFKGTSQMKFESEESEGSYTYMSDSQYDFTIPGRKIVKSSSKSSGTQPSLTYEYQVYSDIQLVDAGVSSLLVSQGGSSTMSGETFPSDEQMAVLFNGQLGQALAKDSEGSYKRATFNAEGYKVDASQAISEIVVDKNKLPAKLASTFSPGSPTGWDCSTTDTVTVDFAAEDKKSAHDACDLEWPEYNSCTDETFESGEIEQQ
jgi:hypothetical protein